MRMLLILMRTRRTLMEILLILIQIRIESLIRQRLLIIIIIP